MTELICTFQKVFVKIPKPYIIIFQTSFATAYIQLGLYENFLTTFRIFPKILRECSDVLSRAYTCDFLLALATRHPQRQKSRVVATCYKKLSSMNTLQHCPSNFVAEPAPGYTLSILVSQSLLHQKEVLCCQCE